MKKRIIAVSSFSGMDLFLLGCIKARLFPGYAIERNFWASFMHAANFKHPDGTPVIEFVNISPEEYTFKKTHVDEKGHRDMEDEVGIIDGQHVRTKSIQEVNGHDVRAAIEARYGKNIIIVVLGGPPCQHYTKLSTKNNGTGKLNYLVFEYLRFISELRPDIALMEEVVDFSSPKFRPIFNEFFAQASKLQYKIAMQEMCSLHYGSNQNRSRLVLQFVHTNLNADPVFPVADTVNVKRVKDFLDIDYFHSGHFTDAIKTKNHFMCTVTSGSPVWFSKNGKKYPPSIDDLLLCMDVKKGEYIIPEGVPIQQIKKAIGNGVCVSVGYALAKTIIEQVLRLKPDGNGYFVSIDEEPEDPDINLNDTTPDSPEPTDNGGGVSPTPDIPPTGSPSRDSSAESGNSGQVTPASSNPNEPTSDVVNKLIDDVPIVKTPPPLRNIRKAEAHPPDLKEPRIINSIQLEQMVFESLNFTGRWEHLLGYPSPNFHGIIHGLSGHGKSTFAIQFAKYLADNFGRVLYLSAEEGFSMTFQSKFLNNDAGSPSLDVADIRTFEEILSQVPRNTYNFIFIDSLDTMKIDAEKLRKIKRAFENTALITISQATKAGDIRGSYEIVHDGDIAVKVTDGVAVTTKNRFKKIEMSFNVFDNSDTNMVQPNSPDFHVAKTKEEKLAELQQQLKDAETAENFELAAKLRDQINRINNQKQ